MSFMDIATGGGRPLKVSRILRQRPRMYIRGFGFFEAG